MIGNRSQLMNFVSKFLGTIRFGNNQIARIMGYGDYQLGNVIISRVYYVEGLGHNLFSVGQFCDADLEVSFWKNTCFIRNLEGVDLLSGSRDTNLYTISLDDMLKSYSIYLLSKASKTKSWLWHRRLSHLNFGTLNKLAKDVHLKATVQNVRTYNGTEFVNQTLHEWYENIGITHQTSVARTPQQNGLSFFHVFGSLFYPTNDNEDLGKFDAKADIRIFIGYAPAKKAFKIYNRRTQIITEIIHVTFDELTVMASEQFSLGHGLQGMTPATSSTRLKVAAPRAEVLADSLVLTSIDQGAPSTSIPSSQEHEQSPIISQGFEELPKTPTFHDDPLNESPQDSTSQESSSNVI
ncbi:integrase, catalytic region, zinc finger, CCHC-type containing protein [Tanacetum coccineum]